MSFMEKKSFLGLTLLLLFLVSSPAETEARLCETPSHIFQGICWSNHKCANVCRHERFTAGHCRGVRRRCFCTRNC